jgi:hypothetical protein
VIDASSVSPRSASAGTRSIGPRVLSPAAVSVQLRTMLAQALSLPVHADVPGTVEEAVAGPRPTVR